MPKYTYKVTQNDEGRTINQLLRANFKFSARFKTKMKYQNLVDLNGIPTPGFVVPSDGDVIGVRLPKETSDFLAEDIPIKILYEDDDLIIINKQPGIIVHPTSGHPTGTIANGIMKYMQDSSQEFKIRFANRIDMDTSGIVIVAKNANAQSAISAQMKTNQVEKKYIAVVHGVISKDHFMIDCPIGRASETSIRREVLDEGGKEAITEVRVLERYNGYSLLECTLHTGRTHQIRVHLSSIGHPIVGDSLYDGEANGLIARQALHSYYLSITHPITHENLTVEAPYPEDIIECINIIKNR